VPTAPVLATQAAQGAQASGTAGLKGRLAFGPDTDGNLWAWPFPAEKPDRLTTFGPGEYTSSPAFSPDGQKIAFSYYKLPRTGSIPIPDGTDLYVMDADGRDPHLLAAHERRGAALQYPAWSPDGTAVYVSYRQQGDTEAHVDRVELESGARSQVVANAGYPSLSADGRRLAYATSPYSGQGTGLWWSAPDGSDPHQILGPGVFLKFFGLRLSPDGQSLLFAAIGAGNNYQPPPRAALLDWLFRPPLVYADGEIYDLWAIDLDGRNLRRLTSLAEDLPISAWAPDGQHVAFLGGGSASKAEAGLAVIDPDGGNLRRLTTIPGHRGVDWTAAP
jgi:Tol biopolymer transport system component